MFANLNKWSMDFLKKSKHSARLVVDTKYVFTCYKCGGEWSMKDTKGIEPIFDRPYISCPHCRAKAEPNGVGAREKNTR